MIIERNNLFRSALCFVHVLEMLNSRFAFPFIVFKGEVLSYQAYGKIGMRHSGDIDLLINKADLPLLEIVLQNSGFSTKELSREEQIVTIAFSHQVPPYRKMTDYGMAEVDVNYDVMWGEWEGERLSVKELLERREYISLYGKKVPVLNMTDSFLVLCLHHYKDMNSLYHLVRHNPISPEKFRDIYFLWKRNKERIDRSELIRIAERYHITEYIDYMVYWTSIVIGDKELLKWGECFRTGKNDLLDCYGLSEKERRKWKVSMEDRLNNPNLPQMIQEELSMVDQQKVSRGIKIFS